MSDSLFVYGTLLPGCRNDAITRRAIEKEWLGADSVKGLVGGRLYAPLHCSYPAIKLCSPDDSVVHGEFFPILNEEALFKRLDEFEGVPSLYRRIRVFRSVPDASGRMVEVPTAWTYEWVRDVQGMPLIRSGDWRKWLIGNVA